MDDSQDDGHLHFERVEECEFVCGDVPDLESKTDKPISKCVAKTELLTHNYIRHLIMVLLLRDRQVLLRGE